MSAKDAKQRAWHGGLARDILAIALLLALCLLFFWPIITPDAAQRGSFRQGDFYNQFYAFAVFEHDQISQGELPLWNPYTFSGHPFLADIQSAVFYPLSLLTMVMSLIWGFSPFALELEAIAHFFLAGVFTYSLARRLVENRGAALIAAVTFMFGGYLTSYPALQLAVLETVIWLPLVLLLLDLGIAADRLPATWRCSQRQRTSVYLLLAGLVLGVAILAGHPQTAMYLFYVSILYYFFKVLHLRRRAVHLEHEGSAAMSWGSVIAGLAALLLPSLGLAAAQLIPSWEYMQLSSRPELGYQELSGGFAYLDLVQIVLPHATGFWSPLYVGIFPLLLALFALCLLLRGQLPVKTPRQRRWWRAELIFWATIAAIALLLSLGGESFIYNLFYLYVPGFGLFRGQERAALAIALALSLLGGYGFAALASRARDPQLLKQDCRSLVKLIVGLGIGVAALLVLLLIGRVTGGASSAGVMDAMLGLGRYVALLLAGCLVWLLLWRWGRGHWLVATILALAIVLFDLVTVNAGPNVQQRKIENQFRANGVIRELQKQPGPFRVHNEFRLPGNHGLAFGLEDTWGASPLRLASYERLFEVVPLERTWELLNVGYLVTWLDDIEAPATLLYQEPAKRGEVDYVHRLEAEHPRAWIVYRVEILPDEESMLERLAEQGFDPYAVGLLTEPLRSDLTGQPASQSAVRFLEKSPSRLAVEVDHADRGLLIVSEIHYPGWRAEVDGQQVPVLRADAVLRAVEVPPGKHRVEMVFDPASVKLGLAISAATLLLSLVYLAYHLVRCVGKSVTW